MAYEPEGVIDNARDALGVFTRRVETTVQEFKKFVEGCARETGA